MRKIHKIPIQFLRSLHKPSQFSIASLQKKPEIQAFNESFLSGTNSAYIELIFENWIKDKTRFGNIKR